jgi:hypothetical protein
LPLRRPSDLAQREIVQYVLAASDGLTGEVSRRGSGKGYTHDAR